MIKNLHVTTESFKLEKHRIHKLVGYLKAMLGFEITSLEINFISSENIHQLNKKYLKHNYPTDILSFDYSDKENSVDGELYISVDVAKNNSKRYGVTLVEELYRLVIHGILHLLGYDDEKKNDKIKMKRRENELLNNYKFSLLKTNQIENQ